MGNQGAKEVLTDYYRATTDDRNDIGRVSVIGRGIGDGSGLLHGYGHGYGSGLGMEDGYGTGIREQSAGEFSGTGIGQCTEGGVEEGGISGHGEGTFVGSGFQEGDGNG